MESGSVTLMRIYCAATNPMFFDNLVRLEYPHILCSYAFLRSPSFLERVLQYRGNLIIDSGAFSAWNSSRHIDSEEYIRFCQDFQKKSLARELEFINLDVIPGKPGRPPTQKEIEQAAYEGLKNWEKITRAGINAVPVYHEGEPLSLLQELVSSLPAGAMIGISPRSKHPVKASLRFLHRSFATMRQDILQRRIRPHILGMLAPDALERYPAFSADASSFSIGAGFGRTAMFNGRGLEYIRARALEEHTPVTLATIDKNGESMHMARQASFIQAYKQYEQYLTELWKRRRIVWE